MTIFRGLLRLIGAVCVICCVSNNAIATPDATYPFELTTTGADETDTFQFYISAAGTFYVDCGDNGTLTSTVNDVTNNDTITRSDVSPITYTCTWNNTAAHTIRFGGSATGYSTNNTTAAVRFNVNINEYWNDTNAVKYHLYLDRWDKYLVPLKTQQLVLVNQDFIIHFIMPLI